MDDDNNDGKSCLGTLSCPALPCPVTSRDQKGLRSLPWTIHPSINHDYHVNPVSAVGREWATDADATWTDCQSVSMVCTNTSDAFEPRRPVYGALCRKQPASGPPTDQTDRATPMQNSFVKPQKTDKQTRESPLPIISAMDQRLSYCVRLDFQEQNILMSSPRRFH
ncbi:hypothetical protein LZ32DRAFT_400482 [Colletotrichum eremochloae]|nr:hypothetical protein LZ32DRAFT_400482 [Colletotrichum eremochloae]